MKKNKLKVSTKYPKAVKKENSIIKLLKIHQEGLSPKHIAFNLRLNHETTKSALKRLESGGIVRKKVRGIYELVENRPHDAISFLLQNIILTFDSDKIEIEERICIANDTGLLKVSFIVGKLSQKATMRIGSKLPFNIPSLHVLGMLFQEWCVKHFNICPTFDEIYVRSLELNQDHLKYRLEGIKAITITALTTEYKLYNKRNCLREEYRLNIPITLDFVTRLLANGVISAEIFSLAEGNEKRLSTLEKSHKYLSEFIMRTREKS
jgi:predicted transcriptional regulator